MTDAAIESGFAALLDKVERERGFACASYKEGCLRRRIRTRMRARGMETYQRYIDFLDREPREMDRLVDALTINVTRFFRNPAVWDLVASRVIPSVWFSELDSIRVWSAGCATGEEAVTAAILFHRHAAVNGMLSQISRLRVTGTDVDAGAVHSASRGTYSEADVAKVGPDLRHRYFEAQAPYRLAAGVQRLVRFVRHDLLKDPYPEEPQHLIICRNVLIYFDRAVQQQVIDRFRASLAPGGYLILGRVESLLGASWAFERVAGRERIFRKVS
jgi:chemotaxis methyl-accepting protein methylase